MENSVFQLTLPPSPEHTLRRVLYVSYPREALFDWYVLDDVAEIPELLAPSAVEMYLQLFDHGVDSLITETCIAAPTTIDFDLMGFIGKLLVVPITPSPYGDILTPCPYTSNAQDFLNLR